MQLENSFTVPVPVDEAWRVLLDIERIAPCMPGAALDTVQGDDFTGRVKVKLGPINLTYQGKASFIEKNEATHTAVIDARGKDQRGNGTAAAVVTAKLAPAGEATRVDVLTDLNITGRPAQFGRGVMTDVGNKLLGQFADKLAAQLGAEAPAPAEAAAAAGAAAAKGAAAEAAATAAGAVEEVAAAAEQVSGDGGAAKATRAAGTAAKKTAAAAADKAAAAAETVEVEAPAKKAPPAKAVPAKAEPAKAVPAKTEPAEAAPAGAGPAKAVPSGPPGGPTAPPSRPATGAPSRTVPSAGPTVTRPQPAQEPEPIDLLEVAGGAAMARYAVPAAAVAAGLAVIVLLLRRRRKRARSLG